MSRKPTVFVVDDDLSMREALSSLIRAIGFRVETFETAEDFLQHLLLPFDRPACVVSDVRMPGMGGLELQRVLSQDKLGLPVIFITGHGDIPMTVRAMKAGAVEFLTKPFSDQDLLDAIAQSIALDETRQTQLLSLQQTHQRLEQLTERERQVLVQIGKGLRNKQIAQELGISEVTVKVHRHNLMDKLGARSVPQVLEMVGLLR
jgi:FixJ family two-component response regulator